MAVCGQESCFRNAGNSGSENQNGTQGALPQIRLTSFLTKKWHFFSTVFREHPNHLPSASQLSATEGHWTQERKHFHFIHRKGTANRFCLKKKKINEINNPNFGKVSAKIDSSLQFESASRIL